MSFTDSFYNTQNYVQTIATPSSLAFQGYAYQHLLHNALSSGIKTNQK